MATSCQKDDLRFNEVSYSQKETVSSNRSIPSETEIIVYTQWVIDHIGSMVSDTGVVQDFRNGNVYSVRVHDKLVSLGFSGFNDFNNQFTIAGTVINEALRNGDLSIDQLNKILNKNILSLDFVPIGGINGPWEIGVPCYETFVIELTMTLGDIAVGASAGPWGAVTGAVWGVASAYINFKNCIDTTYSNQ
jgi:hypothetical protein